MISKQATECPEAGHLASKKYYNEVLRQYLVSTGSRMTTDYMDTALSNEDKVIEAKDKLFAFIKAQNT